jgi:hypothetical protein
LETELEEWIEKIRLRPSGGDMPVDSKKPFGTERARKLADLYSFIQEKPKQNKTN